MNNRLQKLDFVAELRLRQWARRNYVPPADRRDSDWHAVVLDEMRLIDRDRSPTPTIEGIVTSIGRTPIEPSRHEGIRADKPHSDVPAPRIGQTVPVAGKTDPLTANYV